MFSRLLSRLKEGLVRLQDWVFSLLARTDQTHREIIYGTFFILLIFAVGTAGYAYIEGWHWEDGFYMTFITLTTIGYTEVHELSRAGRFFTIFIAIFGIGSATFIVTRGAQLLLTSQRLQERHMNQRIARIEDHFIICGYGRIGARIARDLSESGNSFVVIERDEAVIENLKETNYLHLEGDAEQEDILKQAGILRARGLILALPDDSANVFVTLVARELDADLFILSRTTYYRNRRKLLHAGADKVIAPDEVGADRMAQVILRPHVDQFMEEVLHTGALGLEMDEVRVEEDAPLAGRTLAESNFRQRFDAVVIGVLDGGTDDLKFNPSPRDKIKAGDILVVLGSNEMITRLRVEGCTNAS